MTLFLDSDVCIAILRPRPSPVKGRFDQALREGRPIAISAIVLHELVTGALKSQDAERAVRVVETFVAPFEIVPVTAEDARAAARLRCDLERSGQPIGPYDLLIAAQALVRGPVLVTGNAREFERIAGLRTERWTEGTAAPAARPPAPRTPRPRRGPRRS